MIQLRWLERPTGRTQMDDWGYHQPVLERVLQYRQQQNVVIYSGSPDSINERQSRQLVWSAWCDVPVVDELEQA